MFYLDIKIVLIVLFYSHNVNYFLGITNILY